MAKAWHTYNYTKYNFIMSFSDYSEEKILNWLGNNASMPATGNRYIGLFSTNPGETNTGTEETTNIRPSGRVQATFATAANGQISNSAIIDFGNSFAQVTITHFAIFDAASAGNLIAYGALTNQKQIDVSDEISFPIGTLIITLD